MNGRAHKTLVIACGALAKEILVLTRQFGKQVELQCLPAGYHNRPEKIVPGLKTILDEKAHFFDHVLIGYGDCGTGGRLDHLLENYQNAVRMPGAHCYAFYAGLHNFDNMMDEELGTFFLTDYLVRHFNTLIIKGMGLDRFPELKDTYFEHYKKLVYIAQTKDPELQTKAKAAALELGLSYSFKHVGYGALANAIAMVETEAEPLEAVSV